MTEHLKWDGHSHSQLCPHGKGDQTSAMIERAIELGFQRYSITEHAPLPQGFFEEDEVWPELALKTYELEDYLAHARELKAHYSDRIEVRVGLEFDFIEGYEEQLKDQLSNLLPRLDDSLLSVHYVRIEGKYRMIDFSAERARAELVEPLGSVIGMHRLYWQSILKMLRMELGSYRPARIGHIGVIHKFIKELPLEGKDPGEEVYPQIVELLADKHWQLDFNHAGRSFPACGSAYLPSELLRLAKERNIPLVYGSDAHGVAAVGQHYQDFMEAIS